MVGTCGETPLFRTVTQQYMKNSEITPKKPKYFHIPFEIISQVLYDDCEEEGKEKDEGDS